MEGDGINRHEVYGDQKKCNAAEGATNTVSKEVSTAKEKFQPYQTLSKFIDSLPFFTYPNEKPVPHLVAREPDYINLAQKVAQIIEAHPYRFVKPLKFFWNEDITLASVDGKELMAGDGRFGSVFLGYNEECDLFALKYYKPQEGRNTEVKNVINEAALQDKLAQRDVAPPIEGFGFIGTNSRFHRVVLVSKFIAAKSDCLKPLTLGALCLEDAARRRNGYPPLLLSHQYMNLLVRISMHQARLAQCQVIHTDIKCDNVLLQISDDGQQLTPYLIDFGSSFMHRHSTGPVYRLESREESENFLRRYPHFAPEFIYDPKAVSNKSDLYGVGLILRGIGNYLEIPALVCIASRLRMRDPANRPSCSMLSQLIRIAFGKRPLRQYPRRPARQTIQYAGCRPNNLLAAYTFANFHIDIPADDEAVACDVNLNDFQCKDVERQADSAAITGTEQAPAEETGKWKGFWVRKWDITAWLQNILAALCGLKMGRVKEV